MISFSAVIIADDSRGLDNNGDLFLPDHEYIFLLSSLLVYKNE